jgi:hypothetical protein
MWVALSRFSQNSGLHDTATVTGQVPGVDIGVVSFTLDSGAGPQPVATANPAEAGFTASTVNSDPQAVGTYHYGARVAGNTDYLGDTSDVEPLTVVDLRGAWCSPGFLGAERRSVVGPERRRDQGDPVQWECQARRSTAPTWCPTCRCSRCLPLLTRGPYKGAGVAGTDPRTQSPNPALNAFNATAAYLTDHIPGYTFDPTLRAAEANGTKTCPIDANGVLTPPQ